MRIDEVRVAQRHAHLNGDVRRSQLLSPRPTLLLSGKSRYAFILKEKNVGWIVVFVALAFVIFLTLKSVDRETTRNLKRLAKGLAIFLSGLFVLLVISYISAH